MLEHLTDLSALYCVLCHVFYSIFISQYNWVFGMLEVNRGNRWPGLKMVPSSSCGVLIPIIKKQHQKRINHLQWLLESICAGAESTRLSASHCEPQAELCWSTFEQPHTAHWTLFADDQKPGLETKRESIRENVEEPLEIYWMDLLVGQKTQGRHLRTTDQQHKKEI